MKNSNIYKDLYFKNEYVNSFKDLSYDEDNDEYLVSIDNLNAFNFDKIAHEFYSKNNLVYNNSIDALYENDIFIEFKNGANVFKISTGEKKL